MSDVAHGPLVCSHFNIVTVLNSIVDIFSAIMVDHMKKKTWHNHFLCCSPSQRCIDMVKIIIYSLTWKISTRSTLISDQPSLPQNKVSYLMLLIIALYYYRKPKSCTGNHWMLHITLLILDCWMTTCYHWSLHVIVLILDRLMTTCYHWSLHVTVLILDC